MLSSPGTDTLRHDLTRCRSDCMAHDRNLEHGRPTLDRSDNAASCWFSSARFVRASRFQARQLRTCPRVNDRVDRPGGV